MPGPAKHQPWGKGEGIASMMALILHRAAWLMKPVLPLLTPCCSPPQFLQVLG